MQTSKNKQKVRRLVVDTDEARGKVLQYMVTRLSSMKDCRTTIEETWVETYAQYIASSEAQGELRSKQLETVGNVGTDWRHNIDVGKAFEVVETIHAYLLGALFPNDNWFDAVPRMPADIDAIRIVKKFMRDELKDLEFEIVMDDFVRQMVITGNSCLFFPWDDDNDRVDLEVINVFDCWLDAIGKDPMNSDFVRRMYVNRSELEERASKGQYELIDELDVAHVIGFRSFNTFDRVKSFQGLNKTQMDNGDIIEVYEYWGSVIIDGDEYKNMVITFCTDKLLSVQQNEYYCGVPMVYCNYIPMLDTVYGIGSLQSSLGLIHVLNILQNQRLDGIELVTNPMWTKKSTSNLTSEELYAEPGKVLEVDDHDDVRPMTPAQFNVSISYEEADRAERAVDKNCGTGPLVGAGGGRTGERVTAAEIAAVREAGGNRLSSVHRRLEKRGLTGALNKIVKIYQQYKSEDSVVRYAGDKAGEFNYAEISPSDIMDVRIDAKGSDHVIEKRKALQDIYDFLAAVNQDQEMGALIDKEAVLRRVMRHLPFDDPQEFLKKEATPAEDPIAQIGGQSGANAINQQLQTDGGNSLVNMLKDSYGRPATTIDPTSPNVASAGLDPSIGQSIDVPQQ